MALLTLPVDVENANYDFNISLDGVVYNLEYYWNERAALWQMSVYDSTRENLLLGSIPLVLDFPLTYQYVADELPPGDFLVINLTGDSTPPNRNNLGTDVKAYYNDLL